MKVLFEPVKVADIEDLIRVQNLSFYEDYTKYGYCPGYHCTYDRMKASIEARIVYKIVADGHIIGKISVRDDKNGNYFLGCLCVIPAYENKGIGQSAIHFIEGKLSDAIHCHWSLETPADKERNLYFYKKCGYHITKEYMEKSVKIVLLEKNKNFH